MATTTLRGFDGSAYVRTVRRLLAEKDHRCRRGARVPSLPSFEATTPGL